MHTNPRRLTLLAFCLMAVSCRGFACASSPRQMTDAEASPQTSSSSTTAAPEAEGARPKIVALGDSLTVGYGLPESQAYPALLQRVIDAEGYSFEVENAGVSGDTSAGGLRRLDWALQGNVRILIVALGGNDALRGLSVADMKSNLSAIIERARSRSVTIILAGMLDDQRGAVEAAFAPARTTAVLHEDGWCAVALELHGEPLS